MQLQWQERHVFVAINAKERAGVLFREPVFHSGKRPISPVSSSNTRYDIHRPLARCCCPGAVTPTNAALHSPRSLCQLGAGKNTIPEYNMKFLRIKRRRGLLQLGLLERAVLITCGAEQSTFPVRFCWLRRTPVHLIPPPLQIEPEGGGGTDEGTAHTNTGLQNCEHRRAARSSALRAPATIS